MRHGVSRHGVLYPVFPYAHFALLSDADLDALFAWLQQLPASERAAPPNRLEFPAGWRPAQVLWRMLHYRAPNPDFGADQPRNGAAAVISSTASAIARCATASAARWARCRRKATSPAGAFPVPAGTRRHWTHAQLERYSTDQLADYLRSGTSAHGSAYGPMAEVVYNSLRHLSADDALAMATFLKTVPPHPGRNLPPTLPPNPKVNTEGGAALYRQYCEDCHASDGRGKHPDYPPLADAVSVTAPDPVNAVRLILYGAMAPTTAQNPRPHSMPPFVQQLDSAQVAALTNYIRATFGGQRPSLTAADVDALHGIVID